MPDPKKEKVRTAELGGYHSFGSSQYDSKQQKDVAPRSRSMCGRLCGGEKKKVRRICVGFFHATLQKTPSVTWRKSPGRKGGGGITTHQGLGNKPSVDCRPEGSR